jgi:hypothetical protein
MWMHIMSLVMIKWNFVFQTPNKKQRLTIKLNILEMCFYHIDCDFLWNFFGHKFSIFEYALLISSFIMVCTHLRCYTRSDVQFIMCALCEKKWFKELMHQRKKKVVFSSIYIYIYKLKN